MTGCSSTLEAITPFQAPIAGRLPVERWFNTAAVPTVLSPIDEFSANLFEINKIYLQASRNGAYTPTMGSLVYLGLVSAVESYFRSLIRRLIRADPLCGQLAGSFQLSYAAALHHHEDMLPEALLESTSLASRRNVAEQLRALCSITGMGRNGAVPARLTGLFENFEVICQVRHCGIHRFGKLGSDQAFNLKIDSPADFLEKPLELDVTQLQEVAEAVEALIRGVNSHCFSDVIKRSFSKGPLGGESRPVYSYTWVGSYDDDRVEFEKYYSIFAASTGAVASPSPEVVYEAFRLFMRNSGLQNRRSVNSPAAAADQLASASESGE